jgi:uncharacterized membrane protein
VNETLLQLGGRLHPMLLHLPIGMFAALVIVELWGAVRGRAFERGPRLVLCWLLALSAGASVGTGILLSEEPGYGGDTVELHRWLGIVTAATLLIAAVLRTVGHRRGYRAALVLSALLIVPTGHFGASMTHGDGFLTAPFVSPVTIPIEVLEADGAGDTDHSWYESRIAPIFDAHCTVCHGATRRKGGLALHTAEAIEAGGESGSILAAGGGPGPLLRRIRLPLTDEDHMPPATKPQLSPAQIEVLEQWIDAGASFDGPLPGTAAVVTTPTPDPVAASREPSRLDMESLQAAHVHVEIIDPESMSLWIDLTAVPEMSLEDAVGLLGPLAPYIAELSLRGVSSASQILARCRPWERLSHLDLSYASLDRDGLAAAAEAGRLEELTLIGTSLTPEAARDLGTVSSVEALHVWESNIPGETLAELREKRPALVLNDGSITPPVPLEVEPAFTFGTPAVMASLTPVNTTCPVSGQPVDDAFAIVHDGRVVAFCCEACPGRFWEDPGKFPIQADRVGN